MGAPSIQTTAFSNLSLRQGLVVRLIMGRVLPLSSRGRSLASTAWQITRTLPCHLMAAS